MPDFLEIDRLIKLCKEADQKRINQYEVEKASEKPLKALWDKNYPLN